MDPIEIKKIIEIQSSSDRIFKAITEEEELKKWWVDVPKLEKKVGGDMLFRFLKENSQMLEKDFVVGGKIIEFSPNHKLSYTWKPVDDHTYPETVVTWMLASITDDKTKLILIHSGLENANDANLLEEGWSYFLNKLVDLFKPN